MTHFRSAFAHAPRVQIVNGQIVINEASLVSIARLHELQSLSLTGLRRTGGQVVHEEPETAEDHEVVFESNQSHVTSSSFSSRTKSERWTSEETKRFYEVAVRQSGHLMVR